MSFFHDQEGIDIANETHRARGRIANQIAKANGDDIWFDPKYWGPAGVALALFGIMALITFRAVD